LTLSEAMRTRDASRLRPEDDQQARELEPEPDADHGDGGIEPSDS
jgi:hypothetical protein